MRPVGSLAAGIAFVAGLIVLSATHGIAAPADLPRTEDELARTVTRAIEGRDYDTFEAMVFWKDAGKIKKRIVAFQIRSGLGRKVRSVAIEPFDPHKLDALLADGRHAVNLDVTHLVRVVYDEPRSAVTGKPPTSVFLAGRKDDAFRIALVVRTFEDDDDD